MTKTLQGKKPILEINTNSPTEPILKTNSSGFSTLQEDPLMSHYKSVSTVTSPTNKNLKPVVEIP